MLIGEVSKSLGMSTSTIRYYEKIGLLPYSRNHNGYRDYPKEILSILGLVVKAKQLGFSLKEIKEFSHLFQELGEGKGRIREKLELKITNLDERIKELNKFKKSVKKLLDAKCPL